MRTQIKAVLVVGMLMAAFVRVFAGEFGTNPKEQTLIDEANRPANSDFLSNLARLQFELTNAVPVPDKRGDGQFAYYKARRDVIDYVKTHTNDPSARFQASLVAVSWIHDRDRAMAVSNSVETFNRYSERVLTAWEILLATTVLHRGMAFSNAVSFIGVPNDESGLFAVWRYKLHVIERNSGILDLRAMRTPDGTISEWSLQKHGPLN